MLRAGSSDVSRLTFHVFTFHYAIFVPQLGQNLEPSGTSALQLGQIISPPILPPHWGQNFEPAGICAEQLGHIIVAAACAPGCIA